MAAATRRVWPKAIRPRFSALTRDSAFVWSVNPDNDSVSVIEVAGDKNQKLAEVPVGDEPRCVAITPDDKKVYVTNAVSGTVSVIGATARTVLKTVTVGTEPTGCALSLDGTKLYVANFSSDSVSVIDTYSDTVAKTIEGVGAKPRAIAVAEVNGKSKVYVTQFLAQLVDDARSIDQKEGHDDGREGRVTLIDGATDSVTKVIRLAAKATGFASNGSTIGKVVFDAANPATLIETFAFPNQLESIVVRGNRAYLPNTASSPDGPVKFNVNLQAFVSVIDIVNDQEVGDETFNMNKGVNFEAVGKKLFPTNPSGLAFKHAGGFEGFVLSRATDRLVRLVFDANGRPTINAPTGAADRQRGAHRGRRRRGRSAQLGLGRRRHQRHRHARLRDEPRLARRLGDRHRRRSDPLPGDRAHRLGRVADGCSCAPGAARQGALQHLDRPGRHERQRPRSGRPHVRLRLGQLLRLPPARPDRRGDLDVRRWPAADGVDGKHCSASAGTGARRQRQRQLRTLAAGLPPARAQLVGGDEIQDFELNVRNVSGGQGLIALKDAAGKRAGVDPCVFNLRFVESAACPATRAAEAAITTGRDADLDAIAAYIAFGIRAPVTPTKATDADVAAGRTLFAAANCQGCHGGANWTASTLDFGPPPQVSEVTAAQLTRFLCKAGTFDAALANELKGGAVAGQLNTDGANGGLGINIPSLLSVFASGPFFHSGAASTLDEVLGNVTHRSLGTFGVDTLTNPADRADSRSSSPASTRTRRPSRKGR